MKRQGTCLNNIVRGALLPRSVGRDGGLLCLHGQRQARAAVGAWCSTWIWSGGCNESVGCVLSYGEARHLMDPGSDVQLVWLLRCSSTLGAGRFVLVMSLVVRGILVDGGIRDACRSLGACESPIPALSENRRWRHLRVPLTP